MTALVDTSILIDYRRGHDAAAALGRRWLPSHNAVDSADLAIAATAVLVGARLLTRNVRHFPMFPELQSAVSLVAAEFGARPAS